MSDNYGTTPPAKDAMELAKRIGNECHSKHGDDYYEEEAAALIQSSFEAWRKPKVVTSDSLPPEYEPSMDAKQLADALDLNPREKWPMIIDEWAQDHALNYLRWASSRQSASESSGEWLRERMIALRDAGDKTLANLADWNRGYDRAINDSLSLLASRPAESAKEEE